MKRDIIIIEDKTVSVTGNEVWMTAGEIAEEFHATVPAVNAAIKAVRKSDVLNDYEVCRYIQLENGLYADVYSLEIIIPVAFRLNTYYTVRLRTKYGQTSAAWGKYGPAIEACADPAYYSDNISQIAARFGLKGTHLANQLRVHYSELLRRREAERQRLGLSDNQQRGVRPYCAEKYAEAVELFRTTLLTRREIAERLGISLGGFAQHLLYYHKDLIAERRALREAAKYTRKPGTLTGCGTIRKASPTAEAKYGKAVELYRTTALSVKRIAEQEHVSLSGLTHHIGTWHRDAILERRGAKRASSDTDYIDLSRTKHYLRSTAEKYGKAIEKLKNGDYTTAQVAAEYGLHPECMRAYLKEHEPELYARQGMTHLANGRTVSRRSMEKYAEAIRLYETTDESLKSIARRLNLTYNSLDGYVRRNHSDLIEHRKNTVDNNRK